MSRWFWGIAVLLAAANVFLSARHLSRPGIYFDEILLLLPIFDPNRWIHTPAWSPFPWFMNFYIGGLRTWIYYPFVKFLPISVELLRWPNVLLYAATLLILAAKFRRSFGNLWALVVVGGLALNANLIASSRADFVPFVFGLLFRGWFLAWIFERGLLRRDRRSFAVGALLLLAGIFHRLDFMWTVGAMLGAGALVELWRTWLEGRLRNEWGVIALRALFLAAPALLLAVVMSASVERASELGLDESLGNRILLLWMRLESVLLSTSFAEYDLSAPLSVWPGALYFYLVLMALPFFTSPRGKLFQVAAFCGLYSIFLFALMIFIRRVGAGWHMLLFEPVLVIWWASGACAVVELLRSRPRLRWATCGVVLSGLVALQAQAYLGYQRIYQLPDHEISFYWNRAIYSLVEFRRAHPEHFVNLGWGTYREAGALAFNQPTDDGRLFADISEYLANHPSLLVVTPATRLDAQLGAEAGEVRQFRAAVHSGALHAELVSEIGDPGYPVYEIWRCRRP